MLAPAIAMLFVLAPTPVASTASRQIAAPCRLVEERSIQYLREHEFDASSKTVDDITIIDLVPRKDASTPSGKALSMNRQSIQKYALPRHLSPFKEYADFRLEGHIKLTKAAEGGCTATMSFGISAYEWVWALGVIDDGYRSRFFSNGTLERLYLDAIGELFTSTKR